MFILKKTNANHELPNSWLKKILNKINCNLKYKKKITYVTRLFVIFIFLQTYRFQLSKPKIVKNFRLKSNCKK